MSEIVWQGNVKLGPDGETRGGGFVTYDKLGCVRGSVWFLDGAWGWSVGSGDRIVSGSLAEALTDANDELFGVTRGYDVIWDELTGLFSVNNDMWYGRINGFLIGTIERVDGVYSWEMHVFNGDRRSGKAEALDLAKRKVVQEFAKRMMALGSKKEA